MSTELPSPPPADRPPPPIAPPPRAPASLGLLLFLLAFLILLWVSPYIAQRIAFAIARGQEVARAEVARNELKNLPAEANRYPLVVKIIEPSVVGIKTVIRGSAPLLALNLFQQEVETVEQGSGVIVDPSGYIVTNAHVVSQARVGKVSVQLSDGRTTDDVTIVGTDPATDLAVLKINVGKLSAARWGDSDALEVGDPVLAVGSPYGLAETVTAGIISAKGRKAEIQNVNYNNFLQTDAAINPGNSGGPLVNMNAEVIGINTAIVGHAYQGIGFAIPSNLVKEVYELLRTKGISRGWIGVEPQDLTPLLAQKLGLKDTRGALVRDMVAGSPAEQAGIQVGDVIVRWNASAIADSNDMRIAVAKTRPGAKVKVALYRDGKLRELIVTPAERPSQAAQ